MNAIRGRSATAAQRIRGQRAAATNARNVVRVRCPLGNALRNELAESYDALGERDRALALVREVLARDPLDGVALQLLERYTKP